MRTTTPRTQFSSLVTYLVLGSPAAFGATLTDHPICSEQGVRCFEIYEAGDGNVRWNGDLMNSQQAVATMLQESEGPIVLLHVQGDGLSCKTEALEKALYAAGAYMVSTIPDAADQSRLGWTFYPSRPCHE